jgi:hypothetical protein
VCETAIRFWVQAQLNNRTTKKMFLDGVHGGKRRALQAAISF